MVGVSVGGGSRVSQAAKQTQAISKKGNPHLNPPPCTGEVSVDISGNLLRKSKGVWPQKSIGDSGAGKDDHALAAIFIRIEFRATVNGFDGETCQL
jgi:hypothetical protein